MRTIEELYGSFGHSVVAEIQGHVARNGDVSRILNKLNLPPPAGLEAQHAALRAFIYQYGITFFMNAMKSDMSPNQVEQMKAERLLSRNLGDTSSRTMPRKPLGPADTGARKAYLTPPPVLTPDETSGKPSSATDGPQPTTEAKWIISPSYIGADRRSGKERRHKRKDRRARVDVIYSNKRYGGRERRKSVRRADDREKSSQG
jgi:hypothetical protein